jgi:hypothetical protein
MTSACEEWSCGVTERASIPEPAVADTANTSTPSAATRPEMVSALRLIEEVLLGRGIDGRSWFAAVGETVRIP